MRRPRARPSRRPSPSPPSLAGSSASSGWKSCRTRSANTGRRRASLFKPPPTWRDTTSWCDEPDRTTSRRRSRCKSCERAHTLYADACDGQWRAECAVFRLARRGAVRRLAERRAYEHEASSLKALARESRRSVGSRISPSILILLRAAPDRPPWVPHRGAPRGRARPVRRPRRPSAPPRPAPPRPPARPQDPVRPRDSRAAPPSRRRNNRRSAPRRQRHRHTRAHRASADRRPSAPT